MNREPETLQELELILTPQQLTARRRYNQQQRQTEASYDWTHHARPAQLPPQDSTWTTWLILGGRGAGKTRAGAEWTRSLIEEGKARKVALMGASFENIREVMVEGLSGLLNICPPWNRPHWWPSRHKLVWPDGAEAHCFSAADPEGIRGYQFDAAWSDELAHWPDPDAAWSNLQLALRLAGPDGSAPRQVVTTTPRNLPLLKRIIAQGVSRVTRMTTYENRENLASAFMTEIISQYEGTRLGRQELLGEILEDAEGALWTRAMIEAACARSAPPPSALERIIIAVDPPAGDAPGSSECGIIVAGRYGEGRDSKAVVLADLSTGGLSPHQWAARVTAAYHQYGAQSIIVEGNQGGVMAVNVLTQEDHTLPVNRVTATRSKIARAEPVSLLYEKHRVIHAQVFPQLEDQMLTYSGQKGARSPDRLDALVWALTDLMIADQSPTPRVHFISNQYENKS